MVTTGAMRAVPPPAALRHKTKLAAKRTPAGGK